MAENLRIVYDNALKRVTSIAPSEVAGSLVAANLSTQVKTEVWRSTSTSPTLTLVWPSAEYIGCVSFPFCNLSATAEIKIDLYTESTDSSPVYSTGFVPACPDQLGNFNWGGEAWGVNAFAFGGSTYATLWVPITLAKKVVISFDDPDNTSGYIEASNLVIGNYWSPIHNCEYGASITFETSSKTERTDSGDLWTDRGCEYKKLSFELAYMPTDDKKKLWQIVSGVSKHTPLFISIVPEATDVSDEQIYQVYGKFSNSPSLNYKFLNQFDASAEVEEL